MRILLVAPPWLPVPPPAYGGIEWVVSGLAEGLTDAGHDVTLLASGGSKTQATLETVFDSPPFEQLGDSRIETIQALTAYRRRRDYDLIHDHTAAVGPALASLTEGPPVVHTLHLPWGKDQIRLARLIAPPVRLVAISHDQAAHAPDDIPITAVVHNGIPIDRYPFRADKEDYLLFVGRANPEKGPRMAIEISRLLGRPLIMAMKINERYEHEHWQDVLQPLIASDPAGIEVVPNPDHERKAALMAGAAAVVMPIQWAEPFGLVMPEANACGTPVVAFDVGAASEVVAHGRTGFVVPADDLEAFCTAVERTKDLAPGDCRRHVVERFSTPRMVADYERVFESVSAAAGGTRRAVP